MVPIKLQLTGAGGQLISDAEAKAWSRRTGCRLQVSASGAQSLAPSCMSYDVATKQFTFNWKLGTKGTGTAKLVVTITYPGTTQVTTRSSRSRSRGRDD